MVEAKTIARTRRVLNAEQHDPARQLPLEEVCKRVVALAQVVSGVNFYPYQVRMTHRLVESLLKHDGEVITALFSRQSGKSTCVGAISAACAMILPILAQKFPDDWKLNITDHLGNYRGFANGLRVGIYAPRLEQANVTFDNVKRCFETDTAKKVLAELQLRSSTFNGNTVRLNTGSRVLCQSASEQSRIEGQTHHLLIVEECVTGGTLVSDASGPKKTIREIVESGELPVVLSFDGERLVPAQVTAAASMGVRKIVRLTFDDGTALSCTPNHKIYTEECGWVEAETGLNLSLVSIEGLPYCERNADARAERLVERNPAGGRLHVAKRPVSGVPLPSAEGVPVAQVSTYAVAVHAVDAPQDGPEPGSEHVHCPVRNPQPSFVEAVPATVLPEREANRSAEFEGAANPGSVGLLVHGRRKSRPGKIPENFGREKNHGRTPIDSGCLSGQLRLGNNRSRNVLVHPTEIRSAIHGSYPAVRRSERELQICERTEFGLPMRDLRENIHPVQEARQEPVLLSPVPPRMEQSVSPDCRVESQESGLRPSSKRIVEIAPAGEEEVFDLTVEGTHCFFANDVLVHNCQDVSDIKLRKSLSPMLASTMGTMVQVGTAGTKKCYFYNSIQENRRMEMLTGTVNNFFFPHTICSQYNSLYARFIEREKARLGEESDEFLLSYCGFWLFERGMFIVQDALFHPRVAQIGGPWSKIYGGVAELPDTVKSMPIVAGIDWGSMHDSTVVCLMAVDWNNPQESISASQVTGLHVYNAFNKHVVGWIEFRGDDYETQFGKLMEIFSRWMPNLKKITTDSNTSGKPMFDRLVATYARDNIEVEPFDFNAKRKSNAYKSLSADFGSKRLTFPAGPEARKTQLYRNFVTQMLDLRKEYRNGLMQVAHPDEKGARDDHPDALVLAAWGAQTPSFLGDYEFIDGNPFMGH